MDRYKLCLLSIVVLYSVNVYARHALSEVQLNGPGGPAACAKYAPADGFDYNNLKKLVEDIGDQSFEGVENQRPLSVKKLEAFNKALDLESTQALYEIFANAKDGKTRVFFGPSSELGPHAREGAKDGGEGLRVIWQRTVGEGANRRLISAITFWSYNEKNKRFEMIGGPDGLRVRTQLTPDAPGLPFGKFGALSFSVDKDKDGKVKALAPGVYFEEGGKRKAGLPYQVHPQQCHSCHNEGSQTRIIYGIPHKGTWNFDFRDLVVDEAKYTGEEFTVKLAMELVPKEVPKEQREALVKSFSTPRDTFFPPGILDAVSARCRELGAGAAPVQGPAAMPLGPSARLRSIRAPRFSAVSRNKAVVVVIARRPLGRPWQPMSAA